MKTFIKIVAGVLTTVLLASCVVFLFNPDLIKTKFWEKDDVTDDTSTNDTSTNDTSTDDSSSDSSDVSDVEELKTISSGVYKLKEETDFSSLGDQELKIRGVKIGYVDGTSDIVRADANECTYLKVSKSGILLSINGTHYSVLNADGGDQNDTGIASRPELCYFMLDSSIDVDSSVYACFCENFQLTNCYSFNGKYQLKSDVDFSTFSPQYSGFRNVSIGVVGGSKLVGVDYISVGDFGIKSELYGNSFTVYDAATGSRVFTVDGYTYEFLYLEFDHLVYPFDDSGAAQYSWLAGNIEPYVEPEYMIIDGNYTPKADADFSTIPGGSLKTNAGEVFLEDGVCFNAYDITYDSYGISANGGYSELYNSSSHSCLAPSYTGELFAYIAFDNYKIEEGTFMHEFYTWFLENFETYVAPVTYTISGNYKLKDNADFSALTESVRLNNSTAYFVSGNPITDDGNDLNSGTYNTITFKPEGIYYSNSYQMGEGYIYSAQDGTGNVNYENVVFDYITVDTVTKSESFYNWFMSNMIEA